MSEKERVKYSVTKRKNREMRVYAPKVFADVGKKGLPERATASILERVAEKPIQKWAYKQTGKKYRRYHDAPSKGSDLYNQNYFKIKKNLKLIVGIIVTLITGGSLIGFIFANTQLGIGASLGILFAFAVKWLFDGFKK